MAKKVTVALDKETLQALTMARLRAENITLKAQAAVQEAQSVVDQLWRKLGLDPEKSYDIDFKALTATEVVQKPLKVVK